ncbi:MAG: hypothetical protein C4534_07355 [Gaiellales bacterium]|nr:MAG: hypothetical protein C4534_07355 [Gaiellales bacterium]
MKKQTIILVAAALLLASALLSGCGKETEKADGLIREANDIIAGFQPKLVEVEALLSDARDQAEARSADAAARLEEAQTLTAGIEEGISDAKGKIDEAAGLNIEEQKRSYLEAKSRSLDIMLELNATMSELAALLLADPAAQSPDTLKRWAELVETMNQQSQELAAAEAEAGKIVGGNGE